METQILTKNYGYQVKDIDEVKGIVTIYINAFNNEDTDGDISAPGSFKRTFKNQKDRIQHWLNHDRDKLIGVPLELKEDDHGAIAVSQLNLKKEIGRDVFEDYKLFAAHNKTLEHSVRVRAIKRDTQDERIVMEWKLFMEYSTLYGWGANSETPMIDIKSMDELELMIREGNYSDEKARLIEKTYEKLKQLINSKDPQGTPAGDPPGTLETDPPALNKKLVKHFYKQLKL